MIRTIRLPQEVRTKTPLFSARLFGTRDFECYVGGTRIFELRDHDACYDSLPVLAILVMSRAATNGALSFSIELHASVASFVRYTFRSDSEHPECFPRWAMHPAVLRSSMRAFERGGLLLGTFSLPAQKTNPPENSGGNSLSVGFACFRLLAFLILSASELDGSSSRQTSRFTL